MKDMAFKKNEMAEWPENLASDVAMTDVGAIDVNWNKSKGDTPGTCSSSQCPPPTASSATHWAPGSPGDGLRRRADVTMVAGVWQERSVSRRQGWGRTAHQLCQGAAALAVSQQ